LIQGALSAKTQRFAKEINVQFQYSKSSTPFPIASLCESSRLCVFALRTAQHQSHLLYLASAFPNNPLNLSGLSDRGDNPSGDVVEESPGSAGQGWSVTPTDREARESATENKPPMAEVRLGTGKGEMVR
jgi:hypothetical protein